MSGPARPEADAPGLYPILELLDRLEDVLEEMDDLGVASRDDVERRLAELHAEVSDLTGESPRQEP